MANLKSQSYKRERLDTLIALQRHVRRQLALATPGSAEHDLTLTLAAQKRQQAAALLLEAARLETSIISAQQASIANTLTLHTLHTKIVHLSQTQAEQEFRELETLLDAKLNVLSTLTG